MIGTITFNPAGGGVVHYDLSSISNIHTDGSGNLKFNVAGSTAEFTFAATDEGAAQRIAAQILNLKRIQSDDNYVVGPGINYASPTISNQFLIYEPLNNVWYLYLTGTNMGNVNSISFNGLSIPIDPVNSSSTNVQSTNLGSQPAFATYVTKLIDASGNVMVTAPSYVFSVAITTCNPFPPGGSVTCTVNGSSGLVGGVGTNISFATFPALGSQFDYIPTTVSPGVVTFIDDSAASSPMLMWYTSAAVIVSNYIKM